MNTTEQELQDHVIEGTVEPALGNFHIEAPSDPSEVNICDSCA